MREQNIHSMRAAANNCTFHHIHTHKYTHLPASSVGRDGSNGANLAPIVDKDPPSAVEPEKGSEVGRCTSMFHSHLITHPSWWKLAERVHRCRVVVNACSI